MLHNLPKEVGVVEGVSGELMVPLLGVDVELLLLMPDEELATILIAGDEPSSKLVALIVASSKELSVLLLGVTKLLQLNDEMATALSAGDKEVGVIITVASCELAILLLGVEAMLLAVEPPSSVVFTSSPCW